MLRVSIITINNLIKIMSLLINLVTITVRIMVIMIVVIIIVMVMVTYEYTWQSNMVYWRIPL